MNRNREILSPAIRALGGTPNGDVWTIAKTVVPDTAETPEAAAAVLANSDEFVAALAAQAEAKPAPKAKKEKGFLQQKIAGYEPVEKTETWVKPDGTVIACTPKQKAHWENQRAKAKSAKVTQAPEVDAKALLAALAKLGVDPEALLQAASK